MSLYKHYAGTLTADSIKPDPGHLRGLVVRNNNVSTRYLQFHDTASKPLAGATAALSIPVPGSTELVLGSDFFVDQDVAFTHGIGWAVSTTIATFTDAATASEHDLSVVYA